MEIEEVKKTNIIAKATKVFMRYGIKAVSMDDIAREIGVSKKTLYLIAKDKSDLLKSIFQNQMECDKAEHAQIVETAKDAIEELFIINKSLKKQFEEMHPSIMFDLQKFYPEVWALFNKFKFEYIYVQIINNINRGKQEGFYDIEINAEVYAKLFIGRFDILFDSNLFPSEQFDISLVHKHIINYHIRAMALPKGFKLLLKYNQSQ